MSETETPFENNFDELRHKLDISETLSNVEVSNPFSDVTSSLFVPVVDSPPLVEVVEGNSNDQDAGFNANNGFFQPNITESDKFKDFDEADVSSVKGDSATLSVTSDQNIERISYSDESSVDEGSTMRGSQVKTNLN